jgi:hypothetical protein
MLQLLGGSMYVSSNPAIGRVLAVALVVALAGFGIPALHASAAQATQTMPTDCAQPQPCPTDPHAQHEAQEAQERAAAKQQKEAEHAQHEAAEACERQQKKYAHAQHEAEEAQERAAAKQAIVKDLESGQCQSTAKETTQPPVEIERTKPTPAPEVAPMPEPTPAPPEPPKELPKTASPMSLIGLIGLLSCTTGCLTRFLRR